ncbi:MAG: hypothetical protein MJZ25_09050 [Fibrobacter sp.]|nr:hypothetical protein [Fibrobacter sp.]
MSKASEMYSIAVAARSKSSAQAKYENMLERLQEGAKAGRTEANIPIMKKIMFETMASQLKANGAELPDTYADDEYDAQYKILDMFRADGFDVNVEKKTNLILLGNENNDSDPYTEANATVSWDGKTE